MSTTTEKQTTTTTSLHDENGTFADLQLSKELAKVLPMAHDEGKCGWQALAIMLALDPEQIFGFVANL